MNITASQTSWMLVHVVPGQPACLESPSPHKQPPHKSPGLSAPERNARSQKQVACPRRLRESSCLSLRASRLAAACRLRQSGRRDRAPVALSRSGCPVCRSHHPAAFPSHPQSPPPAAPRGILRSHLRLSPPVAPAKRRAIFFNHTDPIYQSRPPNPKRDLFDPTLHSGSTRQGVRWRARSLPATPGAFRPSRGGLVAFSCGARLARVECLQKEGWGGPHTPFVAREACRRRIPSKDVCRSSNRLFPSKPSSQAAGVSESPAVRVAPIGRVDCAGWLTLGSSRSHCMATRPSLHGSFSLIRTPHASRRATPCLRALLPSRQALAAVGSYA